MSHHLNKLKHERLDARWRGTNDSLTVPSLAQFQIQVTGDGRASAERKGKDRLTDHGSKLFSHDAT